MGINFFNDVMENKIEDIRALLNDLENDRVERTISTTNTDKFGQAICAFANDLPNHQQLGYLFLGVKDDGTVQVTVQVTMQVTSHHYSLIWKSN